MIALVVLKMADLIDQSWDSRREMAGDSVIWP